MRTKNLNKTTTRAENIGSILSGAIALIMISFCIYGISTLFINLITKI